MLNQVGLVGRVAKDPELKVLSSGTKMTNLLVAVERDYTNQEGEREADFISVEVWRRLAENCAKFLQKGRLISVQGRLEVDNWEDQETGERRYKTGVVADQIQFLDQPADSSSDQEAEEASA